MRIAYVLTQDRGGPVDVCYPLAAAMAEQGAEVAVFGPRPARQWPRAAELAIESAVAAKSDVRAAAALRGRLLAWRPDVVHAQDRRSGLVTAGLGWGRRRPVTVHTYHGVPDDVTQDWFTDHQARPAPSSYTRTVLAADAAVARAHDVTTAPSPTMLRFLRQRLRVPARRSMHLDNGIPLPAAEPRQPQRPRALLFVGLLVERKGVADLLSALAELVVQAPAGEHPGVRLDIAGDGPQRVALEELSTHLGLSHLVSFLGFRSDVADLMRGCDAVVLPSHMEQQPLVLIEAMAVGRPVLATDCGGVADMLVGSGCGLPLAVPGDPRSLAALLRAYLGLPDPATTGAALARHARQRFSIEASTAAHLRLYTRLVT